MACKSCRAATLHVKQVGPHPSNRDGEGLAAERAQTRIEDLRDERFSFARVLDECRELFIKLGLLDSRAGLVIVLMLMNLPIIVWMLYTYFREIPGEILRPPDTPIIPLRDAKTQTLQTVK